MSTRVRSSFVVAAMALFVAAIGLLIPTSSGAAPYPPSQGCTVSVSNNTVTPGQQVNLTGSGFPANKTVALSVAGTSLGSAKTDGSGNFSQTVDIPFSIGSGQHTINAASGSTTCSFGFGTQPVDDNRPPNNNNDNNANDSGPTASTGFQTLTASVIAGILLVGGGVLLLIGRRRGNA